MTNRSGSEASAPTTSSTIPSPKYRLLGICAAFGEWQNRDRGREWRGAGTTRHTGRSASLAGAPPMRNTRTGLAMFFSDM